MAPSSRIPVRFGDVFPQPVYALSVQATPDFEKSQAGAQDAQARDKETGERVWTVLALDTDPAARRTEVRVKVTAPQQPVLPEAAPGVPFRPVEFEGLTLTPYVDSKSGRLAYSFRATGVRAPGKDSGQPTGNGSASATSSSGSSSSKAAA